MAAIWLRPTTNAAVFDAEPDVQIHCHSDSLAAAGHRFQKTCRHATYEPPHVAVIHGAAPPSSPRFLDAEIRLPSRTPTDTGDHPSGI
jgi:hypothetical protein